MKKYSHWEDFGPLYTILVMFTLTFGGIIYGFCADDTEEWTKLDEQGNCYLYAKTHRNAWLTPPAGNEGTVRITYCK